MNAHTPPTANVLASRALLAGLKLSVWTARRLDAKVTEETNRRYHAEQSAGRFNKALVAKEALSAVNNAFGEIRRLHYTATLPWTDEGLRVLPATGLDPYKDKLGAAITRALALVDEFCDNYPTYIEEARSRLGDMFNAADYPDPSEIRSKFAIESRLLPIPEAADFRCSLSPENAAKIKDELDAANARALQIARRDAWTRVADVVGAMVERLAAYRPAEDGEKAAGIFRDSIVTNVIELANQLPTLNLTDDPALAKVSQDMGDQLTYYSAQELRENAEARRETLEQAQAIMGAVARALA